MKFNIQIIPVIYHIIKWKLSEKKQRDVTN